MEAPASRTALISALATSLRRPLSQSSPSRPLLCQCGPTRGKKKNAKARNDIWIKLLKDVPAYGRKGAIVPVPIGQMRKYFYPQNLADYVHMLQQREMRRNNVIVERDATFGREIEAAALAEERSPEAKVARRDEPRTVDLKLLPPRKVHDLLSETIPQTMTFYRTPIAPLSDRLAASVPSTFPTTDQTKPTHADIDRAARAAAPPPDNSPRQSPDNIYGSVSSADIAVSIRALLQNRGMAGLVVLPDEDVVFVDLAGEGSGEADRVKKLGEFAYEIRIKGLDGDEGIIRRNVRVLSDDGDEVADLEPPSTGPESGVAFGAVEGRAVEGA